MSTDNMPSEQQVEAAARVMHEHNMRLYPIPPWDELPVVMQHAIRERVLPIVTAVVRA